MGFARHRHTVTPPTLSDEPYTIGSRSITQEPYFAGRFAATSSKARSVAKARDFTTFHNPAGGA